MKRIVAFGLTLCLLLCMTACGERVPSEPKPVGSWKDTGVKYDWSASATDTDKATVRNDLYEFLGGNMDDEALFEKLSEINSTGVDEIERIYRLNDDQSGSYINGTLDYPFHWELNDHTVTITMDDGYVTEFTIDGDEMHQTIEQGGLCAITTFVRQ